MLGHQAKVRETGIVIHFLKQVEITVKHKLLSDVRIHWLWENKHLRRGYLRGPQSEVENFHFQMGFIVNPADSLPRF